ncbi:MAG: tRNA (guanosine(37)-N1)-methyltransferase TrmD [Lentisphaerae bacterium]|nr:tRNA (guanosine(37)-N1)-methyltransferase TrmD [Lentisphaerota bacterium]
MRIDILTLFPELFPGPLGGSIIGRAARKGLFSVNAVDVRSFAEDSRGTVDEKPYGGGPGMLMMPDVLTRAVESVKSERSTVILTSPRGEVMNQQLASELAKEEHLILVAGHYEGVDQRFIDLVVDREISIGDFVLSSGNIAAMAIADAVIRLLPGVLGDDESAVEESHSMGLLEYPQYTRPPVFRGMKVPDCLVSGDHGKVAEFRRVEAEKVTRERRPDLWEKYLISELNKEVRK